jgi:3-polyprenyl-4-hydroxybenzoate decarboxylase
MNGGRRIAVGVTGASGAIYAARTIAALLEQGCHLELVFSDYGKRLLLDELGPTPEWSGWPIFWARATGRASRMAAS